MARNFGICDVSFGSLKGRGPARCLIGATVLLLVGIMGCSELAVSRIASKAQDDCQDCGPANGPTSRQDADQKTSDIIKKDLSPDRFEVVTTTTQNLFSQNQVLTFTSPNRKIHLQFALRDRGTLHLAPVFFAFNQSSAEPLFSSYLGLNFTQTQLRSNFTIDSVRESEIREHFRLPIGRISRVDDSFREIHIVLRRPSQSVGRFALTFRIYNDAIAVRSEVISDSTRPQKLSLLNEDFGLRFPLKTEMTALPLAFGSAYEARYRKSVVSKISASQTWGLPAVFETPRATLFVSEANLHNYANAYLKVAPSDDNSGATSGTTSDTQSRPDVRTLVLALPPFAETKSGVVVEQIVSSGQPFQTPWRVMWIGEAGERGLRVPLESSVLASLNEPAAPEDWSWVHPGKVLFQWWNGYTMPGETFDSPADVFQFSTLKKHVDFCADHGIEYFSIDGYEFERAWYGGPVLPYDSKSQNILVPMDSIQMSALLSYAKSRGVKSRLWFPGDALQLQDLEKIFAAYQAWGIDGIMVDFLGDDTQTGIFKNEEILKSAARHHLVVSFHGIAKPTGLTRTYPHLLSQEGVMGQEYNKWQGSNSTPDHEVEVGIIRGAVGPMDTHQGSFRPVPLRDFKPRVLQPNSIGTLSHQLSTYIVYENEQPMLADYPEAYEKHLAEFEFVRNIPLNWDETRVLRADLSQHVFVVARQSGKIWYVGVMVGDHARNLELSFDFLAPGEFEALIFHDAPASSSDGEVTVQDRRKISSRDKILFRLVGGGGAVLRIEPKN